MPACNRQTDRQTDEQTVANIALSTKLTRLYSKSQSHQTKLKQTNCEHSFETYVLANFLSKLLRQNSIPLSTVTADSGDSSLSIVSMAPIRGNVICSSTGYPCFLAYLSTVPLAQITRNHVTIFCQKDV